MPELSRTDVDSPSPLEHCKKDAGNLWGIVLVEHRSPKPPAVTQRLSGPDLFKQYHREIEHRSMFRRTLDRVNTLIAPNKRLVVTSRDHVEKDLEQVQEPELLVVQPRNRDTAPGVLLTLLRIQDQDPDATVAIFPSEHCAFIPNEVFMPHVLQGIKFLTAYPDLLILFGTGPERPEIAHSWIEPGEMIVRQSGYQLLQVWGMREGRDHPLIKALYPEGGLWNSRIVLGRLSTLLQSFQKTLPELWERFQRIEAALHNADMLEDVYRGMPVANFFRHILQRIPQGLGVVPVMSDCSSDWKKRETRKTLPEAKAGEVEEVLSRLQRRHRRWEGVA